MKFHLNAAAGNAFTGYGDGYVEINGQRYESSLLVTPETIDLGWSGEKFEDLRREDFARLLDYQPEIVLLGTGKSIRFPHPRLVVDLTAARIGLDVMDVHAACRTFNVLSSEGRRVLAALLLNLA